MDGPGEESSWVGLSLIEAMRMFPDDEVAEKWIAQCRWGDEPACPKCGSLDVQAGTTHPNQPYRCRILGCRRVSRLFSRSMAVSGQRLEPSRDLVLTEEDRPVLPPGPKGFDQQ